MLPHNIRLANPVSIPANVRLVLVSIYSYIFGLMIQFKAQNCESNTIWINSSFALKNQSRARTEGVENRDNAQYPGKS